MILFQNTCEPYEKQYHKSWTALAEVPRGRRRGGGGLVLWISSDGEDWMGAKIKTQKIPRASNKPSPPPKKPWTKNYTPEIPIANFWALLSGFMKQMQCSALNIEQPQNNAAGVRSH